MQTVDANGVAEDAQIAMDGRGLAAVVYSRNGNVMTNFYHRVHGWRTPVQVETMDGTSSKPRVAFTYAYTPAVAWIQSGGSATDEIWTSYGWDQAPWSAPERIAASIGRFEDLRLVRGARGNETFLANDNTVNTRVFE